jgi:glycosyltransferase involved in cell wall biosynthesis
VIAFDHGAAREIVTDGVTGYVVPGEEEAARAVDRLWLIDRSRCRREAEEHFSVERLTREHVALYRRVLAGAALRPGWEQDGAADRSEVAG